MKEEERQRTNLEVFPAVDMRQGQVVRLKYGDPDQQTVFGNDPVATGSQWADAGARWLHVVNLDGAFGENSAKNWALLPAMAALPIQLQFGGGIRTLADVERAIKAGATRVVLGTAAVENPTLVSEAVQAFGADHIAIGIDARQGEVKTRGWKQGSGLSPLTLALQMKENGIKTIIYTDISRDGVLTGVNAAATAELAHQAGVDVIASGGVATLDDIRAVAAHRLTGVIIGRALYDGQFTLAEALQVAREAAPDR